MSYKLFSEQIIGRDPDMCTSTGQCNAAKCHGRGPSNCGSEADNEGRPCCRFVQGADIVETSTTYNYHKGWRSSLVPSYIFDNAVSFHNPQRDPAPPWAKTSTADAALDLGGFGGGQLAVAAQLFEPLFGSRVVAPLAARAGGGASAAQAVPNEALEAGFRELDNQYFYSRVTSDGAETFAGAALKAGAAYLLEGVVDASAALDLSGLGGILSAAGLGWIAKGTCSAGDIRVHHEVGKAQRMPLLAKQGCCRTQNNTDPPPPGSHYTSVDI